MCQIRESHSEYLELMDGQDCPLLNELAPRMLRDLGMTDRVCDATVCADLWEHLRTEHLWDRSGNRLTMNRFMQAIRIAKAEGHLWTSRLHCQLYCCIQEDLLCGDGLKKQFQEVRVPREAPGAQDQKAFRDVSRAPHVRIAFVAFRRPFLLGRRKAACFTQLVASASCGAPFGASRLG